MPKKYIYLLALVLLPFKTWAVDTTPPTTTYTIAPAIPDGNNGWYVTPVKITLSATDLDSGVRTINYRLNGGNWVTKSFTDTMNLAPNASFEIEDTAVPPASNINTLGWSARDPDAQVTPYTRDSVDYLPGYENFSIRINANSGGWHWISNQGNLAPATPYSNMTASVWVKANAVEDYAAFEVYALLDDFSSVLLGTSNQVTGTTDWTQLYSDFTVNVSSLQGIYMQVGVYGKGIINIDGVTINDSLVTSSKEVNIGTDGEYIMEYYSTDRAGNNETYNCAANPKLNCKSFKIDSTPPGNWHDSGAYRGLFGNAHQLWVYTTVEDPTSGLSTFTDRYTYQTDKNPGSFGRFSDILSCNSTWLPNSSLFLISPPFIPGAHSAYLLTPKTDFCNNDWKTCKTVRFYSEDMAGNSADKDYCINGPWIRFTGAGIIRANYNIDMLSEPEGHNTDGLIDIGGPSLNYFTTSRDWEMINNPMTTIYSYDVLKNMVSTTPTTITSLRTTSGVYQINGNFEIKNSTIPSGFGSTSFNQIVFLNGDLTITNNINIAAGSTAAFVVNGDIKIAKAVDQIALALFANNGFYTAYNISEGDSTSQLLIKGVFSAHKFYLQRTLQGTNNEDSPAEDFIYEPKYITKLKSYFGKSSVMWIKE